MKITIVHNPGFIEEEFSIEMKGGEISAEYETNDGERYVIARVPKGLVNVIYNMQKGLHKNDTVIVETETKTVRGKYYAPSQIDGNPLVLLDNGIAKEKKSKETQRIKQNKTE